MARSLGLSSRPLARTVVRCGIARQWTRLRLLRRHLTPVGRRWLGPCPRESYPLEVDVFLRQGESIRQRVMAEWVAVRLEEESLLAARLGLLKDFPLLDEGLIAIVLQQDPVVHAHRAGEGRRIARKAFSPFLPPLLRSNPSKRRYAGEADLRSVASAQRQITLELAEQLPTASHPLLHRWWRLDSLHDEVESLAMDTLRLSETLTALVILKRVSLWLRWLEGEREGGVMKS
jgi:hypothetical protein